MQLLPYLLLSSALFSCVLPAFGKNNTLVILNNLYKGSISLNFSDDNPCLSKQLLDEWGVKPEYLHKLEWDARKCLTLASAEKNNLQYWYHPNASLLTIILPDDVLSGQQHGVSSSRWDDGINALFINYRLDINNQRAGNDWEPPGTDSTLELANGLNLGAWRLRYKNNIWREKDGSKGSYSRSLSLWRSIKSLRSRLTMGDGSSSDTMFNSISYQGVSFASDEAMYPDSWRPFSPWINGYARTEAEVTIRQNGERVYRIHVPPGPFTIRDFFPPESNGNLELTITESDGTERIRVLPYSFMPNLVSHNIVSYELIAGRYKPMRGIDLARNKFWQSTLSWGLLPRWTLFTGLQKSKDYFSHVIGLSRNLNYWGALSADITNARYHIDREQYQGSVWRLRYARAFFNTETSFSAMFQGYPKHSKYRSLSEKISRDNTSHYWPENEDETTQRAWHALVEINQNLDEDSSLNLSWSRTKNRNKNGGHNSLTLSYNGTLKEVDISLYGSYEHYSNMPSETIVGLTLSIPFSLGNLRPMVGYSSNFASQGPQKHAVNIYGSAFDDYSLHYDLSASHTIHKDDEILATLGYQYNAGETNISLQQGGGQSHYHADISGSIMMHDNSFTLGQTLGDTMALVEIPNTAHIGTYNQFGTKTNSKGELLISYLTPWRVNEITLDTLSESDQLTFSYDELEVIPTYGAIVRARFLPPEQNIKTTQPEKTRALDQ